MFKASSRTYQVEGKEYSRTECMQMQTDALRGHWISNAHFGVIKQATTELQGNVCVWCGGPAGEDHPPKDEVAT